jgi:hypothetical protein
MVSNDPRRDPLGIAIASGAIVSELLDLLVQRQILSTSDVRGVLENAARGISLRVKLAGGFEASQFIDELRRHFPEHKPPQVGER